MIICIIPADIQPKGIKKIKAPKSLNAVTNVIENPEESMTHPQEAIQSVSSAIGNDVQDTVKSEEKIINNALNDVFDLKGYHQTSIKK